jgi:predicted metalloprotease
LKAPTEKQLTDALNAAAVVGDDHIQSSAGRVPNPDSFSHGTSAQRQFWFATGYQQGLSQCDVFAVPARDL